MPKIHQNSADYEQIQRLRRAVQNRKGSRGTLFGFGRGLDSVFAEVQFMHAGLEHVTAENTDHEKAHQQNENQTMKRPPGVKPFRDQVRDGNGGAPLLHDEIAVHNKLRGGTGMRSSQKTDHFVREERRTRCERKENDRAEPHCRIDDSDDP